MLLSKGVKKKLSRKYSLINNILQFFNKHQTAFSFFKYLFMVAIIIATFILASRIHNFDLEATLEDHKSSLLQQIEKIKHFQAVKPKTFFDEKHNLIGLRMDWHNYEQIRREKHRFGVGEHGIGVHFKNQSYTEKLLQQKLYAENGFNGLLSDKISLNRSVPDIRLKDCQRKKYLRELPTVSIIFPFFNEHWSTLLRSVSSVLNRSPPELIKEIILVDDSSKKLFLSGPLDKFLEKRFTKVKLIHLPARSGLIKARLAGARMATGDVLIFLDSHIEANVNWLPPLLDPIAQNYRTAVCPLIDLIDYNSFAYAAQDEGERGAFDWNFLYKRLPLLKNDVLQPTEPFDNPIMAGGLFAISQKFFWELGGYDEGLDIWGGEQYELSFKIWQCGGRLVDAPCSRVGHIYKGVSPPDNARSYDYLTKNFKRVAEVWMDEYKHYLYARDPLRYDAVDPGDLTKQKALRKKLQCKPFKWFLETVAFDLLKKYPAVEPPAFASGAIRSVVDAKLCVDTRGEGPLGLVQCSGTGERPDFSQFFILSWERDIREKSDEICWEVQHAKPKAEVVLQACHGLQGNQLWKYDHVTKLIHYEDMSRCLDSNPVKYSVFVNKCNPKNLNQQWDWHYVNATALDNWKDSGVTLL